MSLSLHILWLHVHFPLVTTSVHITPLSDLFCRYWTFWRLISPCLTYSLQVPGLFNLVCILVIFIAFIVYFLLLGGLIFTYFIATWARTFVDLFCTHTLSRWSFLFMRKFLMSYSVWPILFFYVFYLYIFYGYVHTYLQWPILQTCPFLVTYSVNKKPCGVLFCTQGSLCLMYFV